MMDWSVQVGRITAEYRRMQVYAAVRKSTTSYYKAWTRSICGFSTHEGKGARKKDLARAQKVADAAIRAHAYLTRYGAYKQRRLDYEAADSQYAADKALGVKGLIKPREPKAPHPSEDDIQAFSVVGVPIPDCELQPDPTGADPFGGAAMHVWGTLKTGVDQATAAEDAHEKVIRDIVKSLPLWSSWANDVLGIGEKSIGIIIAEAGDLGAFLTPCDANSGRPKGEAGLRKRMGVAVICDGKDGGKPGKNGIAQGKLPKSASADEWIKHGYSRKRRSALFTIGDSLIKCTDSRYRAMYLVRKEVERERFEALGYAILPAAQIAAKRRKNANQLFISDGHIHRRAQRWMEQKLLRHVLRAWKRTMMAEPSVVDGLKDAIQHSKGDSVPREERTVYVERAA